MWLESQRIGLQCGWLALFLAALWLSVAALHQSENDVLFRVARGFWLAAMLALVLAWLAGAGLEMMRRAAGVSGRDLVWALAAFSILVAGAMSLVRDWFGARYGDELRGDRLALSLAVLTFAGWWFGGLCLQENPFWQLDLGSENRAPDAWALSLGGATLLGMARLARSRDESVLRCRNPRVIGWWLVGIAVLLGFPGLGDNPRAASVFLVGAGAFWIKIWRARRDKPLFFRVNWGTRAVLILVLASLPLFLAGEWEIWVARAIHNWQTPHYSLAFLIFVAAILSLGIASRPLLRLAVFEHFCRRALLMGALVGTLAATILFGPAGAIFWAFWPLAGLFFDLLSPNEPQFTAPNSGAPPVANSVSARS